MPRGGIADTASISVPHPDLEVPQIEMVSSGVGGAQTDYLISPPSQRQPQQPVLIPRVRGLLRVATSDLFTPQTVLIGPYHVDQVGSYFFQSTIVKEQAVQHIMATRRVDREGLEAVLRNLVNEVRPRYTYLPEDSMNSEAAFSSMLLLDGCYLLCRFIKFDEAPTGACDGGAGSSSGVSSSSSGGANGGNGSGGSSGGGGGSSNGSGSGSRGGDAGGDIAADPMRLYKDNTLFLRDILYLLENQIPLCVLEVILNYIRGTENIHYASDHIYGGVQYVLHKQHYISQHRQPVLSTSTSTPSDLLHLVYCYFRRRPDYEPPGSAQKARSLTGTGRWRRATDYRKYANLHFRPRMFQEGEQWTILDMDFQGDTLYIPFLQVTTDTWTMLRNLMALEEQEEERPITAYCLFMSQVACTAEDVQLLQRAKVLQHFMPNDKEAAKAFSYLCDGVAMDIDSLERNYLKPVWHDLHKRCGVGLYNFKGFFRDKYCSTVFYRLVFSVATLLFISQLTQATYAVITYHTNPHS